jgi:glyoxylase-like metal-dependent hydrolase (beta-lactamase superfamily II)
MPPVCLAANNASEWTGPTGNSTYLLGGPPSVLIDAGIGNAAHVEAVARALGGAPLDLILITHHHGDHVAGVPALLARWPAAIVRGGGAGPPLNDGEHFDSGSDRLRAIHTPGHAPDHFCFLDEASMDLYGGDLVRIGGTVVIPASRGGSLTDYLRSLDKVRALRPARILPAHGPAIDDPPALIDAYVQHRRERHEEILAAHCAGCRTPAEIVARVYPTLAPSLKPAAEETVRAHLEHARLGSPDQ